MTEAIYIIGWFAILMVAVFMYRDLQYILRQICDDMEALCVAVRALHEEQAKKATEEDPDAPDKEELEREAKKAEEAFVNGVRAILNYEAGLKEGKN